MAEEKKLNKLKGQELEKVTGGQTIGEYINEQKDILGQDPSLNPNMRQMQCHYCPDVFWFDETEDQAICHNGHINTVKG